MFRKSWLLVFWAGVFSLPAFAQTQTDPVFTVRRMKDWNETANNGRCIIRVRIDDETDVELRGEQVRLRTVTGRAGRDDGSECTQPLPSAGITNFKFKGIDGRGEVRLVQEPRESNRYIAVVSIKDKKGGDHGYTYELSWNWDGTSSTTSNMRRPGTRPGRGNAGRDNTGFGNTQQNNPDGFGTPASGSVLPNLGGGSNTIRTFNGLDETITGSGPFRIGSRDYAISRLRAVLRSNGSAEITVYSNEVFTLLGQWSGKGQDLTVNINNGFGNAGASGTGRISLTSDYRLQRVVLDGTSSRFRDGWRVDYGR